MKKIQILVGLLLFSLAFVSCESTDINVPPFDDFSENFGNVTARSFTGQVVDSDNHPIQNATVTINTASVSTDVNGVFIINNVDVFEKFAYIKAAKTGYLNGSRSMVPTTGRNTVKIMLLPDVPYQTIQSGVHSDVSMPSGTKISFDGAFVDENGSGYSGEVKVCVFHLTTSDENLESLMPGMLYAENSEGDEVMLQTFGMLRVELRGTAGQKLNLANGHTAEITMPIDVSQTATAPASIPLWHFDEVGGYWKQEGIATKVGFKYVGTVSHFSWWNCDAQFPTVRLTTTVVDGSGNPLANLTVSLLPANFGYSANGNTNANGQVSGLVPANTSMVMTIRDICGNVIHTETIGPFAADYVMPNTVIPNSTAQPTVVQGTLLKCDNTNVTNGYVLLNYGTTHSLVTVTNGAFSFNTIVCPSDTSFSLQGFDYDNLQTTGTINYTFTPPVTNVGLLSTCNTVTEFITYQIDSDPPVTLLSNLSASTTPQGGTGQQLYITSTNNPIGGSFYLNGTSHVPGIYTTADGFTIYSNDIGEMSSANLQYNLSSFGAVGQYVDMTVSGTYVSIFPMVTHTLTVTAHVVRDF